MRNPCILRNLWIKLSVYFVRIRVPFEKGTNYDPAAVSIDDTEAALRKAKTYQGTAGAAEDK